MISVALAFDLICLATNIYFEARGEDLRGQLAVAEVTLNRVHNDKYPDSICAVVLDARRSRASFPYRHQCQFSWQCDGKREHIRDVKAWQEAYTVAYSMLHIAKPNLVGDSLHYHAERVAPKWANHMRYVTQIGDHVFYEPSK